MISYCLAVSLGLAQAHSSPPQDEALELLRKRLEARDAQIRNVLLAYEAHTVFDDSAQGNKAHREIGWWYWQADLQATAAIVENDGQPARCEHVVWDGARARRRWGPASWEDGPGVLAGTFPAFPKVEITDKLSAGLLGRSHSPGQFGSFMLNSKWSEYLGVFSNLQVASASIREGRPVVTLLGDMDGRKHDLEYSFPWRITFDEQTLLATEIEYFTRNPAEGNADVRLNLDGSDWYRIGWRVTDEWKELAPGIWFGTHGKTGHDTSGKTYTEVRVLTERSFVNGTAPASATAHEIEEGAQVDDATTGQHYSEGHRNDPDYELNSIFSQQLRAIDPALSEQWQHFSGMSEPFSRTSFAGAALYAFMWLDDRQTRLATLLQQETFQELSRRAFEASDLERVRSDLGRVPRRLGLTDALRSDAGWCLWLSGGQLAVVRRAEGDVLALKPLSGFERLPVGTPAAPGPDDLLWTLGDDTRWTLRQALASGGAAAIGLAGVLVLVSRRRQAASLPVMRT